MLLPSFVITLALAPPTPVTLLSGFLGAGKTCTLQSLLTNAEGLRLGVVVNDVAKLNIDADLVADSAPNQEVVRLQNGCACCSIAGQLTDTLRNLAASAEYDHIVVELSGVAEPDLVRANLQEALRAEPDFGVSLPRVVTLVDASAFLAYFDSAAPLGQQPQLREVDAAGGAVDACADAKVVSQLLMTQVDSADTILVNKLDLVDGAQLSLASDLLTSLNPKADLLTCTRGKVPVTKLIRDEAAAQAAAQSGCCDDPACTDPACTNPSHGHAHDHSPAGGKLNVAISSFVYSARAPFVAEKLAVLLNKWPLDRTSPLQQVTIDLGIKVANLRAETDDHITCQPPPGAKALRFAVGARVECNVGTWKGGKVTRHWYTEAGWDEPVPYQVLLDDGAMIYAPKDDDRVIREEVVDTSRPTSPFGGVLRSKGWVWLTLNPHVCGCWSHAGKHIEVSHGGSWWAAAGDAAMREALGDGERYERAMATFEGTYGDSRQEIVFIGTDRMDEAAIRSALDECLVRSKDEWARFESEWAKLVVVEKAGVNEVPRASSSAEARRALGLRGGGRGVVGGVALVHDSRSRDRRLRDRAAVQYND